MIEGGNERAHRMPEHYGRHIPPTVQLVRDLARAEAVLVTEHAADMLLQRYITSETLHSALCNRVEMVEDYPDDPRGHSCLVECTGLQGDIWHCVCSVVEIDEGQILVIITVYEPGGEIEP